MPPFGRLAAVIVSGPSEDAVRRLARRLSQTAPRDGGVEVLGPAPAPLALLRGRYRYRLLMKTPRETQIQRLLREWLDNVSPRGGLRVQIDVDPYSFM
jgi:primosomal protein N' (replication factor Y)